MGMFDHLVTEVPTPDGFVAPYKFQTKSFECLLDNYRITKVGYLEREEGWMTEKGYDGTASWEPFAFTGEVYFYDYDREGEEPLALHDPERWHEYRAVFEDGRLLGPLEKREEPEE